MADVPDRARGGGRPAAWNRLARVRARLGAGPPRLALAGLAALGALLWPQSIQGVTYLEQAERLQLVYAFLLDYRPAGAPRLPRLSIFELQGEVLPIPKVDPRVGAKDEPVDTPEAIPRARARIVSASGLMLGITASPREEAMGYSAHWAGAELGLRGRLGALHGELRGFVLSARVTGPVTEPGAKDEFDVRNRGGDFRVGLALGPLMPYAGLGSGHSESTLTVAADGARLESSADYRYGMAGVSWSLAPVVITYEQHRTEDFLNHYLLAAAIQF
jgi:hypothetical protein